MFRTILSEENKSILLKKYDLFTHNLSQKILAFDNKIIYLKLKFPRITRVIVAYYKFSYYIVCFILFLGSFSLFSIFYLLSRFYRNKSQFFWYMYHTRSKTDYFLMNVLRIAVLKAVFENPILYISTFFVYTFCKVYLFLVKKITFVIGRIN